jgi:hypothetical protein
MQTQFIEIALGQIEEVIEIAKDELNLVKFYIVHKGWELDDEAQKEADTMIGKMADSIYFTNPLPPKPLKLTIRGKGTFSNDEVYIH